MNNGPVQVDLHSFLTSCHLNWCLLTTEKTESKPCVVINSRASFTWNGWRHGAVAWMLHTTVTSAETPKHQRSSSCYLNNALKTERKADPGDRPVLLQESSVVIQTNGKPRPSTMHRLYTCSPLSLAYLGWAWQTPGWFPGMWRSPWTLLDSYDGPLHPRPLPPSQCHCGLLTPTHWRNWSCVSFMTCHHSFSFEAHKTTSTKGTDANYYNFRQRL